MGTWGPHSFDNDDAKEWCQAYREMGLFVAKSTMEVALGDLEAGGLSADVACRAVAAVEAVAFAVGRGSTEAAEAFAGAPDADPAAAKDLIPTAVETIDAILGGSQLNTRWTEAGAAEHKVWVASVQSLKARVQGQVEAPQPAATEAAAPSAISKDEVAELKAAIDLLGTELQVVRREMREGLVELARRIVGRNG